MIAIASSFALGVLSSLFVWWLTQHYWKPRLKFSDELAEYIISDGDSLFQSAFENCGKRDIIEVQIFVRIGIEGFLGATGWAYHMIRTNASLVPVLSPGKRRRVRIFDTRSPISFVDDPSVTIGNKIKSCKSLRDILQLGTNASVSIHVFGYDSFSGVRKHFPSKQYFLHDIRKGTFKDLNVVQNTRKFTPAGLAGAKDQAPR